MRNDDENEEHDCLLCLLPLQSYDHSHPLQCPSRHCHFNCCMDCLEHMIKSTKDEHTEASDGNTFRVFLHCPNCRSSHLGLSIRDTLLLRKVDKYSHRTSDDKLQVIDDELSASELRFKYALEKDEDVAFAVEGARSREDDFFGWGVEIDTKSFDNLDDVLGQSLNLDDVLGKSLSGSFSKQVSIWSFDDEEGFEADLTGPHRSFIFRHHSIEDLGEVVDGPKQFELEDVQADSTLLCGLDAFMTDQEQQFMTAQLISGNTARLAVATEMIHYVSALSLQGIKPNLKRRQSGLDRKPSMKKKRSMLESIKEVIREGNEARRLEEEKEARKTIGVVASQLTAAVKTEQFRGMTGGRRNLKMQVDMEVKKQMEYMKLHPLPLRMPKYAEVTANKAESLGLTFWDDTWDGTILDAFSKITVTKSLLGHITVTKQHAESSGIRCVINAGSPKSNGKGYIDTEKPRVIVASINRDLGRQGVVKGDVVSHFNGEPFMGTASELMESIDRRYKGEVLTFVFNADSAVAEALKRRSMISEH